MNKGRIFSREISGFIDDTDLLMELAGLDVRLRYEDIGIMSDGVPVVFDRCGNFGYLDPQKYRFIWDLTE